MIKVELSDSPDGSKWLTLTSDDPKITRSMIIDKMQVKYFDLDIAIKLFNEVLLGLGIALESIANKKQEMAARCQVIACYRKPPRFSYNSGLGCFGRICNTHLKLAPEEMQKAYRDAMNNFFGRVTDNTPQSMINVLGGRVLQVVHEMCCFIEQRASCLQCKGQGSCVNSGYQWAIPGIRKGITLYQCLDCNTFITAEAWEHWPGAPKEGEVPYITE